MTIVDDFFIARLVSILFFISSAVAGNFPWNFHSKALMSRTRGYCRRETAMETRLKSSGTDVMLSMTTMFMTPKSVRSATANRKILKREITASVMSCLIETIQVGLTTQTCGFAWRSLKLSSTGYELSPFGVERAAFIETIDEVLSLNDPEYFCYKFDVADVDIDLFANDIPAVTAEGTGSSASIAKSTASTESAGSDMRRKKSKKSSRQGSMLSQAARPSAAELEMSPWLTTTEPISRDISAEDANLIQFYANPLKDFPASVAAG